MHRIFSILLIPNRIIPTHLLLISDYFHLRICQIFPNGGNFVIIGTFIYFDHAYVYYTTQDKMCNQRQLWTVERKLDTY